MNNPKRPGISGKSKTADLFGRRPGDGRIEEWTASPFSARPYYPFALGNGSECITVDYTGSMLSGYIAGHAHKEQHQGLIPGWYKNAHRVYRIPRRIARQALYPTRTGCAQPCIQAGYIVMVNGENTEPSDFAQSFDARRGVLTTDLILHGGHWRLTAYLTDSHVWAEHMEALDVPCGQRVDFYWFIAPFTYSKLAGLELSRQSVLSFQPGRDGSLRFDYQLAPNEFRGRGMMWSAPRGRLDGNQIVYTGVKTGFAASRYLLAVDEQESAAHGAGAAGIYQSLRRQSERRIRGAHAARWLTYAGRSRVVVPDGASQKLYDLSMYWMRANQYPDTGSLNLGPFPCHWFGGANTVWDAGVMQRPLLQANHLEESRQLLEFYKLRMPRARAVAKALGLPGARFCFFCSATGQDNHTDPQKIRMEKISANASVCRSFYEHWRMSGRDDSLQTDLGIMRELLEHVLALAVLEQKDRAYIVHAAGAAEGRCPVSNDSLVASFVERALRGCAAMAAAAGQPLPRYLEVAEKLARGLRENVRQGILMADKNSAQGGSGALFFVSNLPESLRANYALKTLRHWRQINGTPWGFDKPQKNYRDWPWCHCWLSTVSSHLGRDSQAFGQSRWRWRLQFALRHAGENPPGWVCHQLPVQSLSHAAYLEAMQTAPLP